VNDEPERMWERRCSGNLTGGTEKNHESLPRKFETGFVPTVPGHFCSLGDQMFEDR
jgi:hypothetical protein